MSYEPGEKLEQQLKDAAEVMGRMISDEVTKKAQEANQNKEKPEEPKPPKPE